MTLAETLKALYDHSQPLGMGILHFKPGPMPIREAEALATDPNTYFDYLMGRVIKSDIANPDCRLYDRDNGLGAMERALICPGCKACR